jgi:hypothetical protein
MKGAVGEYPSINIELKVGPLWAGAIEIKLVGPFVSKPSK